MKITKKSISDIILKHNPKDHYDIDKAVEELNELATALMQYKLKNGTKTKLSQIVEEIGDVEIRIEVLKKKFKIKKEVQKRIEYKANKYITWIKEKRYKHI